MKVKYLFITIVSLVLFLNMFSVLPMVVTTCLLVFCMLSLGYSTYKLITLGDVKFQKWSKDMFNKTLIKL